MKMHHITNSYLAMPGVISLGGALVSTTPESLLWLDADEPHEEQDEG